MLLLVPLSHPEEHPTSSRRSQGTVSVGDSGEGHVAVRAGEP